MELSTNISNKLQLTANKLEKLFPFAFSLDKNLSIQFIGVSLIKILPRVQVENQFFSDLFQFIKPTLKAEINFEEIELIESQFSILKIKHLDKVFLKGQFEVDNESGLITFLGTLWTEEYEKLRELGLSYSDFPAFDPIFDIQQLRAVLENEKEDHKNVKNELDIINHASELFIILHPSGLIKKVSKRSLSLIGYKPNELIGLPLQNLLDNSSSINIKDEIKNLIQNRKTFEFSTRLLKKIESTVDVEISISIADTNVSESNIIVIVKDITERLKANQEINNLASFPNENPNPIFRIDDDGNIIFKNKSANDIQQVEYNNTTYSIQDFWRFIFKDKENESGTHFETLSNNKQITFQVVNRPNQNQKNIYGYDNTIKYQYELLAHENFNRLNNFLESTNDIYYVFYHINTAKNFYTSQWPLFFGFNPTESAIWQEKRNGIEPEFLASYDQAVHELHVSGSMHVKYKLKNKITGQDRWILEEARIKFDSLVNDEIISGRMTDITVTENYLAQIKESENRFELITESMPVMIWVSNEKNIVTYTNQTSRDFYGFDLRNLKNADDYARFIHPDYRKIAIDEWAIKINTKTKCSSQYLASNKDGEYRWINEIALPRFTQNGIFLGYIGCCFDITEEKHLLNKVEEEKRKFELISTQSADIIMLLNEQGYIQYASPSIERILGYKEIEIEGILFSSLLENSNTNIINELTENHKKNRVSNFRMKDSKGVLKWIEASSNTFSEPDTRVKKIIVHLRDINEQYTAQSMLIENEAKYRNLFTNMNLGIMEVDINEKILYVNAAFERISGYTEDELIGKVAPEILLSEISEKEINLHERRNREHGKEGLYEIKIKRKNGTEGTWVISGAPTFDMRGKNRGSIGIHWDVTDIRNLEKKMLFESLQKEKELIEARLYAEEEQREVIGRDLHDGVGQMLAYISVYMNVLKEKEIIEPADIDKAQSTIKKTIDEVRRLSRNLAPPAIKDLGFRDAVVELIGSYAIIPKPLFKLKIYRGQDPSMFLYEQKIMLFRILQELSSNTFKYADANLVEIKIEFDKEQINLKYKDDGKGFDLATVKKGIGLKGILSRIEFYGGHLKINTKPNKGTEVLINLPFEQIT
jgi:PAS domain S-box-containing protein